LAQQVSAVDTALLSAEEDFGASIGGRLQTKASCYSNVVFGARNGEASALFVKAPPHEELLGIDGVVGLTPVKARRIHFDFVGKG